MNTTFRQMTGCNDAHLGQNCRFLQGDLENDQARAELRLALMERRRTQVVLKNRRMDGSIFSNLLLLEHVGQFDGLPELALGTQFVLDENDLDAIEPSDRYSGLVRTVRDTTLQVRLERRRIASESAIRLLKSWIILQGAQAGLSAGARATNPQ